MQQQQLTQSKSFRWAYIERERERERQYEHRNRKRIKRKLSQQAHALLSSFFLWILNATTIAQVLGKEIKYFVISVQHVKQIRQTVYGEGFCRNWWRQQYFETESINLNLVCLPWNSIECSTLISKEKFRFLCNKT